MPTIYEWRRHPFAVHGWQAPLVLKPSDETDGMIPYKPLPSMGIPSIHGWKISMTGMQQIRANRFPIEDYHQNDESKLGNQNRSMNAQFGSFLENPWLFDNTFFGTSPREAHSLDPQQRLLLQMAQRALEDAGYSKDSMPSN